MSEPTINQRAEIERAFEMLDSICDITRELAISNTEVRDIRRHLDGVRLILHNCQVVCEAAARDAWRLATQPAQPEPDQNS